MDIENLELVVDNFLIRFNQMCKSQRKNYLIVEHPNRGEGPTSTRYKVKYKSRLEQGKRCKLSIFGQARILFVFPKKFPLCDIFISEGDIVIKGLYTQSLEKGSKNTPLALEELLKQYHNICSDISAYNFTRA